MLVSPNRGTCMPQTTIILVMGIPERYPKFWETSICLLLVLAGNGGMEKDMETSIMGYIGTTIRISSSIPS